MNRVLAACALVSLASLCGACSERIGHGFDWKRMRVQHKFKPYAANPMFADSSAMRTPPEGTISREAVAASAPPPAPDLVRGASRFHIYCAVCHGDAADGVSIVASNMDPPKPPSLVVPPARDLPPAQIFAVITDGFGRMPSLAAELSVADRWQVIAYLGELQRRAAGGAP
jgi:mono/diheme cytochrome c family protein